MKDIFSWITFRSESYRKDPIRDKVIQAAFEQWCIGNDVNKDNRKSSCEMSELYDMFRAGYLVYHTLITENS